MKRLFGFRIRGARLMGVVRKELSQLRRDPRLMYLLLGTPLIQLILFGCAVSTDLKGARLGVVSEDPSPAARQMLGAILTYSPGHAGRDPVFLLERYSTSPADLDRWLDNGDVDVALYIPPGFAETLARGGTPSVQVLSDGTDPNTATLAYQYLSGAALAWAGRARYEHLRRHPGEAVVYAGIPQIQITPRFWYNPELKSVNFLIPGVLALIAMALTLTPTTIMVVKERELGTLEQLSVTPIHGAELLIGKTLPIAAMGLVTAFVTIPVAGLLFGVPMPPWPTLPFLVLCTVLFVLSTLGLGLLLALKCQTQLQAQLIASFITTPMIMLSGFLFPIDNMPRWVQWFTYLLPMRYYMDVVRGAFLRDQGVLDLWPQALALAALGVVLYLAGVLSFRKRVD